jgi:hypothetical protein
MAKQPQDGSTQGPTQSSQGRGGRRGSGGSRPPQLIQWTMAQAITVPTTQRLIDKPRVSVAFPPCAEELLSLIRTADRDDITIAFRDYFKFYQHQILGQDNSGGSIKELDQLVYSAIGVRLAVRLLPLPAVRDT